MREKAEVENLMKLSIYHLTLQVARMLTLLIINVSFYGLHNNTLNFELTMPMPTVKQQLQNLLPRFGGEEVEIGENTAHSA